MTVSAHRKEVNIHPVAPRYLDDFEVETAGDQTCLRLSSGATKVGVTIVDMGELDVTRNQRKS